MLHPIKILGWVQFPAGALIFGSLEIKTFGLGSRIRDMALWDELNNDLKCQSVRLLYHFWPLTASITMEVKNNHVHFTSQGILNIFIEINFSVGCMVWPR